jgi:hypothetical protein
MQIVNYGIPCDIENHDACLDMAMEAAIEHRFFISSPHSASSDAIFISSSLPAALGQWRNSTDGCLSAFFSWRIGDESGSGTIKFDKHVDPILSQRRAEHTFRSMMVREIADRLVERIPRLQTS